MVAEARGTCEIIKDDTRWCKIKFNDGSPDVNVKKGYDDTIKRLGFSTRDPFLAAREVNRITPDKWSVPFAKGNFSTLIAYALWDVDAENLRGIYPAAASFGKVDAVYEALSLPPPNVVLTTFDAFQATASWGCLELVRGSLSILVKTPHAVAPRGCAWK